MLDVLAGLAALILTEWLIITAWLSVNGYNELYLGGAAAIIFLWTKPWSRRDPYSTSSERVRRSFLIALFLTTLATAFIFSYYILLLLALEVVILWLIVRK